MRPLRSIRVALAMCAAAAVCVPAAAAPDAKQIVTKMGDAMMRTFTTGKTYQATIVKSDRGPQGVTTARVRLKLLVGKKAWAELRTSTGKPSAEVILLVDDGVSQWIYQPGKRTCTKQPSAIAIIGMLLTMKTGMPIDMKTQLTYAKAVITSTRSGGGKPAYVIKLSPSKPGYTGGLNGEFTIDKATNRLRKSVTKTSSGVSTLTFENEVFNQAIPPSEFKFTPPPGVTVIDTRSLDKGGRRR